MNERLFVLLSLTIIFFFFQNTTISMLTEPFKEYYDRKTDSTSNDIENLLKLKDDALTTLVLIRPVYIRCSSVIFTFTAFTLY